MPWLNFDTDPPTPMGIEDGEPTPLWNRYALRCLRCKKWYISDPLGNENFCSPGCAIAWNEEKIQGKA